MPPQAPGRLQLARPNRWHRLTGTRNTSTSREMLAVMKKGRAGPPQGPKDPHVQTAIDGVTSQIASLLGRASEAAGVQASDAHVSAAGHALAGCWTAASRVLDNEGLNDASSWCIVAAVLAEAAPTAALGCLGRGGDGTAPGGPLALAHALVLARIGRPHQALQVLTTADAQHPLGAVGLSILGDLFLDVYDGVSAERAYHAALVAGASCDTLAAGFAVLAVLEGRPSEARRLALGIPDRAVSHSLVNLIRAGAMLEDRDVLHHAGHLLQRRGLPPTRRELQELAEGFMRSGAFDDARVLAQTLVNLDPGCPGHWNRLAEVAQATGSAADAAEARRQLAGLMPRDPHVQAAHGWALLLTKGTAQAAAAAFERALRLNPADADALKGLSIALSRLPPDAVQLTKWLRQYPDHAGLTEQFVVAALAGGRWVEEADQAWARLAARSGEDAERRLARLAERLARQAPTAATALVCRLGPAPSAKPLKEALIGRHQRLSKRMAQVPRQKIALLTPAPRAGAIIGGERVEGTVVGHNHQGRVVIATDEGRAAWLPWDVHVRPPVGSAVDRMATGVLWRLSSDQRAQLEARLARPVVGPYSATDFLAALASRGEAFVVGGSLREVLAPPLLKRHDDGDVDLASDLTPAIVGLMGSQLGEGLSRLPGRPSGVISSYQAEFYGLVRFGTPDSDIGLDVTSLRSHGCYRPLTWVLGARTPVLPLAFGANLVTDAENRDFTVNALYWCPVRCLIIDPLSCGVDDARAGLLRLAGRNTLLTNEMLVGRYLKMRLLGWRAPAALAKDIGRAITHHLDGADPIAWQARWERREKRPLEPQAAAAWARERVAILEADGLGGQARRLWPSLPRPSPPLLP